MSITGPLRSTLVFTLMSLMTIGTGAPARQQAGNPPPDHPPATEPQIIDDEEIDQERDPLAVLLEELREVRTELAAARQQIAQAHLERDQAQRELEELRQFIADHHEYGEDFQQYQAMKEIAEREARRKAAEETRARREAEKAQRLERLQAARADRASREAQSMEVARYRRAGFTPLGLEVYAGRMAFHYATQTSTTYDIEYSPLLGRFIESIDPLTQIDYSQMTISGSVLNAADHMRNIGVAITFFDESGNQVGHETIQINNARPDVPYPFTSKIDMALNRAFDSSSIYVLYADEAEDAEESAPATPATAPPPPPSRPQSGGYEHK